MSTSQQQSAAAWSGVSVISEGRMYTGLMVLVLYGEKYYYDPEATIIGHVFGNISHRRLPPSLSLIGTEEHFFIWIKNDHSALLNESRQVPHQVWHLTLV